MDIRYENLDVKENPLMNQFELPDCSSSSSSSLSSSHLLKSNINKDDEIYDSVIYCNNEKQENYDDGNGNVPLDCKIDEKKCNSAELNEYQSPVQSPVTLKSFFQVEKSVGLRRATLLSPKFNQRARNWFKKTKEGSKNISLTHELNASSTSAESLSTKSMKQSKIYFSKSNNNTNVKGVERFSTSNSNTFTNDEAKNIITSQTFDSMRENVHHVDPPVLSRTVETIDLVESDSDWMDDNDSDYDDFSISSGNVKKKRKKNSENHDCNNNDVNSYNLCDQDEVSNVRPRRGKRPQLSSENKVFHIDDDDDDNEEVNIGSNTPSERLKLRRSRRVSMKSTNLSKKAEFVQGDGKHSDIWMKPTTAVNTATQSLSLLARQRFTTRNDLRGGSGVGVGGVLVLGPNDIHDFDSDDSKDLPSFSSRNKKKDNVKSSKAKGRSKRRYKRKNSPWGQKRRGQYKKRKYSRISSTNAWSTREQGFGSYNNSRSTSGSGSYMEISRQDPQLGNDGGANVMF